MTSHEHRNVTIVREGFEAFERGDTISSALTGCVGAPPK